MEAQRPFLYLTLAFLLFLIWSTWQQEHAPKPVEQAAVSSASDSKSATQSTYDDNEAVPDTATPQAQQNHPDTNNLNQAVQQTSATAGKNIHVKTDVLDLIISTQGGAIIQADLPKYSVSLDEPDHAVRIINMAEKGYAAQSGLIYTAEAAGIEKAELAPNHNAIFSVEKTAYQLTGERLVIPLTWVGANGVQVTKTYTFHKGSYAVDVEEMVNNQSAATWTGYEYRRLRHSPHESASSSMLGIRAYVGAAYYDEKYIKYSFGKMEDEPLKTSIKGGWVAMLEHYFISAWIPQANDENKYFSKVYEKNGVVNSYTIGTSSPIKQIASGSSDSFKSRFYVGPKDQKVLSGLAEGLDYTVDYGILSVVSKPIFWLLQQFHSLLGNWGWAIIFVTLAIKILFFYPSAVSYKSMARMKKLAPQLKSMNERYKNDPQGKQKAMMAMYKKEKVNPLGGCLPMLIQIPVFMGLYWVLMESVELRQAPWILWYKDLSVMDPTFVLPVLMGASMFFQQKLNPSQMDPAQQKIFQWLPVVFTVMFLWFPAGLVLYWLTNNLLSIAQQWYINKKIIGTSI